MWQTTIWLLWSSIYVALGQLTNSVDLSKSLVESKGFVVSVADSLGEGAGCFDSDSRYEPATVNCQIWLQWILARSYSDGDKKQFERNLDALRYYETISFAQRKHFVDRWVLYDPDPLVSLNNPMCQSDLSQVLTLQLSRFRNKHHYATELFEETATGTEQHVVHYLSEDQATKCLFALDEGWYVGFFVANDDWIERWSSIGELGLVHAMIIERRENTVWVHHVSMDAQAVVAESWNDFQQRLQVVAKGYRFFALDPNWKVETDMPMGEQGCQ
jgi:hypothetical protein